MGTFTPLSLPDAERVAAAHQLGALQRVVPISAGTVNSNYFLDTTRGRYFVRLYEQQEVDGVSYEWALLDHLLGGGAPLPRRVAGPEPGACRVAGKPVAVFEAVTGEALCQARVNPSRTYEVGRALARAAKIGASFGVRRDGRFTLADVARLHRQAAAAARPELAAPLTRLTQLHAELSRDLPRDLPRGVVHGDLFRDNVLWQGEALVALLDWESASDGVLMYDLAVAALAWCCGDTLDWELATSMARGYAEERTVTDAEWRGLWWMMRLGCLRFATTRITDVHLRGGYPEGYKPFQRFLARLDVIERETPDSLAARLAG